MTCWHKINLQGNVPGAVQFPLSAKWDTVGGQSAPGTQTTANILTPAAPSSTPVPSNTPSSTPGPTPPTPTFISKASPPPPALPIQNLTTTPFVNQVRNWNSVSAITLWQITTTLLCVSQTSTMQSRDLHTLVLFAWTLALGKRWEEALDMILWPDDSHQTYACKGLFLAETSYDV